MRVRHEYPNTPSLSNIKFLDGMYFSLPHNIHVCLVDMRIEILWEVVFHGKFMRILIDQGESGIMGI